MPFFSPGTFPFPTPLAEPLVVAAGDDRDTKAAARDERMSNG